MKKKNKKGVAHFSIVFFLLALARQFPISPASHKLKGNALFHKMGKKEDKKAAKKAAKEAAAAAASAAAAHADVVEKKEKKSSKKDKKRSAEDAAEVSMVLKRHFVQHANRQNWKKHESAARRR